MIKQLINDLKGYGKALAIIFTNPKKYWWFYLLLPISIPFGTAIGLLFIVFIGACLLFISPLIIVFVSWDKIKELKERHHEA